MMKMYLNPTMSIQRAIDSINSPTTIYLSKGIYRQKVLVDKPNVRIVGEERNSTVISFDDHAKKIHLDGKEYNTFRTYTLNIIADGCSLEGLTVENTTENPAHNGQCVALSLYATDIKISNCNLFSTQDTVFCGPLPPDLIERYDGFLPDNQRLFSGEAVQLFDNCYIKGSVDFIFGSAFAIFNNCTLCSVFDGRIGGFVAAPSHSKEQERGLTFIDCEFVADNLPENCVYLARPWRDYGISTFINCRLGKHICSLAFDKWNDTQRDKTARFFLYGCDLPNAVGWCKYLSDAQAQDYIGLAQKLFGK